MIQRGFLLLWFVVVVVVVCFSLREDLEIFPEVDENCL